MCAMGVCVYNIYIYVYIYVCVIISNVCIWIVPWLRLSNVVWQSCVLKACFSFVFFVCPFCAGSYQDVLCSQSLIHDCGQLVVVDQTVLTTSLVPPGAVLSGVLSLYPHPCPLCELPVSFQWLFVSARWYAVLQCTHRTHITYA